MSRVFISGAGAVSPAGWGVPAMRAAIDAGVPLPTAPLAYPGIEPPVPVSQRARA